MEVSISARHVDVTPRLKEVIHEKIGGLDRFIEGLDRAEVRLDKARNPRISEKDICEVVVEGHGHHLRCKVQATDPYRAVEKATLKLERQIRKLRTKLQIRYHGDGSTIRTSNNVTMPLAEIPLAEIPSAEIPLAEMPLAEMPLAETLAATEQVEDEDPLPTIVKSKRFHLGPVTPDEAVLKMELLGHGFFFFINRDTSRSAVVYRRDDGDVGLIDEAG